MLLVLDNFEHLLSASALVAALLGAAVQVQVLATSRAALRVAGEHEFPVPPLAVPPLAVPPPNLTVSTTPDPAVFDRFSAVQLFVERARAVQPSFALTAANGQVVASICARLDGLPLAIELAAARIRLFSPQALLARLDHRLKVLMGGPRERDPRQQTLRNTIEWSYELLSGGEKQLLRRMAVFQGGRTLQALEAVCNYDGQLQVDVVDEVESLIGQSLLQKREGSDGEPRFWMLETIHEYAWEKLRESGEAEALQREHALYFMRLAEEAEPHLRGPEQREWMDRLGDDYDNIRAALRWASEQAQPEAEPGAEVELRDNEAGEVGLRIAGAISRFWLLRGLLTEGRQHLQKLLSISTIPAMVASKATAPEHSASTPPVIRSRVKALNAAGDLASRQGDYTSAQSQWEAALVLGRDVGDKQSIAVALYGLGGVAQHHGDYPAAQALYEESLGMSRKIGNMRAIAAALHGLGIVAQYQGDYSAARTLIEESLALCREIGDKSTIAVALHSLGRFALNQGDYPAARALYEESLGMSKEIGNKWMIAFSLHYLGIVALNQGDYPLARALIEEDLALRQEIGDKPGIQYSLYALGIAARQQEDYQAARALLEESLAMSREIGDGRGIAFSLCGLGIVALEQGDYPAARALLEESMALRREHGDKPGITICLAGLGGVAIRGAAGVRQKAQVGRGARLLGAVEGLLQSMGTVLERDDREPYERSVQLARAHLGEAAFQKSWQEGRAMSMEQAIAYALEEAMATMATNPVSIQGS
jgi:predicted ATPase